MIGASSRLDVSTLKPEEPKKASEQGLKEARIWMENENKGGRESSEHGPYGSVSW